MGLSEAGKLRSENEIRNEIEKAKSEKAEAHQVCDQEGEAIAETIIDTLEWMLETETPSYETLAATLSRIEKLLEQIASPEPQIKNVYPVLDSLVALGKESAEEAFKRTSADR